MASSARKAWIDRRGTAADRAPIERGDGNKAVLLLHGLTGTPHDIAPFADSSRSNATGL